MKMNQGYRILFCIACLLAWGAVYSQTQSVLLQSDTLVIKTEGTAFLGSGMNEDDAKAFAINDAKRNALELAGTYLESHTEVLNYTLVKDEIITYTGGLLKVKVLQEGRGMINNMFAFKVRISSTIDTKLLNERIDEIRSNRDLKKQLEAERERNNRLTAQITELQASGSTATKEEVKKGRIDWDAVDKELGLNTLGSTAKKEEEKSRKTDWNAIRKELGLKTLEVKEVVSSLSTSDWIDKGINEKDLDLQVVYYTNAIEIDPKFATAYYYRGMTYFNYSRYDEAIQDFTKAIELNFDVLHNRANAYVRLARYDEAIRDYTTAIANDPKSAVDYQSRGDVYRDLGKYALAIQDYDKAIDLETKDTYSQSEDPFLVFLYTLSLTTLYYDRGSVYYYYLENYVFAIHDFNKVIELYPKIRKFAKEKDWYPQEADVYFLRGSSYDYLTQYNEAIRDFTQALVLDSKFALLYYFRGVIFGNMGEKQKAVNDFNEYLRLNGNNDGYAEQARQMIKDLGYTPIY